jgi:hypothetical protein
MRADESYTYDPIRVVDPDNDAILVSRNIENRAAVPENARAAYFAL